MKRTLALIFSCIMLLALLTACGNDVATDVDQSGTTPDATESSDLPASWPKGTITYECGYAADDKQDLEIRDIEN